MLTFRTVIAARSSHHPQRAGALCAGGDGDDFWRFQSGVGEARRSTKRKAATGQVSARRWANTAGHSGLAHLGREKRTW